MHIEPDRMTRDQLLARVDSLEAQVDALRDANKPADSLRLQRVFSLTMKECDLLILLSDSKPRRKEQIHSGLYSDRIDDPPEIKIIDVFICKLRKKVEPYGVLIETIWGSGYVLHDPRNAIKRAVAGEMVKQTDPAPREAPPHLFKRRMGEDFNAMLAALTAMADGSSKPIVFTSREMAARTGVKRTISVLLRWMEMRGAIKILQSPPPGGRTVRAWKVQVLRAVPVRRAA